MFTFNNQQMFHVPQYIIYPQHIASPKDSIVLVEKNLKRLTINKTINIKNNQ